MSVEEAVMSMQRHDQDTTRALENETRAVMTAWMSFNMPMFSLMTEINGRLMHEAMKANTELMALANQRLQQDWATSRRMMQCRTVKEVLDATSDFLKSSQERTRVEIRTLSRINIAMADQTMAAVRSTMNDGIPAETVH